MSVHLYPNEKAVLQPQLFDGKGLPLLPNNPNFPKVGITWATADATKIKLLQNPMPDGYSCEIQAVGTVGQNANITMTGPNGISVVTNYDIVGADARNTPTAAATTTGDEPAPVKERPTVGPPG